MQKKITLILFILVAFLANAQTYLSGPQKVVIDANHNRYLISNYNTGHIAQDSGGVLSFFMQGANFRDGLEVVGDTVYGVGLNRKVRAYNLTTKDLVLDTVLAGSNSHYLSSITSDSAGHLFISCPALHTIYKMRISDGAYWVFAENNGLNRPNGILLEKENNRIVVIDDSPNTSIIHAISLSDSTVSYLMTNNFDNPDGITRDKDGYYYVGGYWLPGLYKINPDFSGEPELFFEGSHMIYPTYHTENHSLLITYYGAHEWEEIPLVNTFVPSVDLLSEFNLKPVFPNPFSVNTTINFNLDVHGKIKLEVYDTSGNIVNVLVNEEKDPGSYSLLWDGKNRDGNQVSKGIYFFRLTVDGFSKTQRGILGN